MRLAGQLTPSVLSTSWFPLDDKQEYASVEFYGFVTGTVAWNAIVTADNIYDPTVTPVEIKLTNYSGRTVSGGYTVKQRPKAMKFTATVNAASSLDYVILTA